jgi:hypothetical protein
MAAFEFSLGPREPDPVMVKMIGRIVVGDDPAGRRNTG